MGAAAWGSRLAGALAGIALLLRATAGAAACGDPDGSGAPGVSDGVRVLQAAASLPVGCDPAACDVDGNGAVALTDGVLVLRAAARLPAALTCGAVVYATTGMSLLRSTDLGATWEQPLRTDLDRLAFVSRTEGWLAGVAATGFSRILHTTDGGATWDEQTENVVGPVPRIFDLAFGTASRGIIVGEELDLRDGRRGPPVILFTKDGGARWERAALSVDAQRYRHVVLLDVCLTAGGYGLATGGDLETSSAPATLVLLTTDFGANWSDITYLTGVGRVLACSGVRDLWFGTGPPLRLRRSADGGTTWWDMTSTIDSQATAGPIGGAFVEPNTGWILLDQYGRDVDPPGHELLVLKTADGGASWTERVVARDLGEFWAVTDVADAGRGLVVGFDSRPFAFPPLPNTIPLDFATVDGGATWSPLAPSPDVVMSFRFPLRDVAIR